MSGWIMQIMSQKERGQVDENAILIYYTKTLNFMVFWASREYQEMTLNGGGKGYNVKVVFICFLKVFPND